MHNTQTNELTKENFYKKFFYLAFPIALQQLVSISLNMIDNLMVGQLGVEAIAGVSFANKVFFIYILFLVGSGAGASIFISQYYGKGDITIVRKIFALILILFFVVGIIFTATAMLFSNGIIDIFSNDPLVITIGASYLYIVATSYIFTGISFAIALVMRSISLTKQALYITIAMTLLNTLLNYLLIYGHFGFPRMESDGAALATVIARVFEFLLFVFLIYKFNYGLKAKIKEYFGISKEIIIAIIKVTIPVFFNEAIWVLGTTMLTIAYAMLGTEAAAAVAISDMVMNIGVIIFVAIASSSSILIAQVLGAAKIDLALWMGSKIIRISVVFSVISAIVGLLIINPLLSFYTLSEETKHISILVLIVVAGSMLFKLMNWSILVGILRAGGDVKAVFMIDLFFMLLYAVPIAFVASVYWQLPIYYVVLLANLEEIFKLVFAVWRYKSKKWVKNLVNN